MQDKKNRPIIKVKSPFNKPLFETRVKTAKELLRSKGIKFTKINFADEYYGCMLKSDSIRFDNLWAGYITEEQFTINLEQFARKS